MVLLLLDKFEVIIVIHLTAMVLLGAKRIARKENQQGPAGKETLTDSIMLLLNKAVLPYQPSLGNPGKQGGIQLCRGPLGNTSNAPKSRVKKPHSFHEH